jgi:hypothetical protein
MTGGGCCTFRLLHHLPLPLSFRPLGRNLPRLPRSTRFLALLEMTGGEADQLNRKRTVGIKTSATHPFHSAPYILLILFVIHFSSAFSNHFSCFLITIHYEPLGVSQARLPTKMLESTRINTLVISTNGRNLSFHGWLRPATQVVSSQS